MATLGLTGLNLAGLAKRLDPTGRIATVAELLDQDNGVDTIMWLEGNLPTGNRVSIRSALPVVGTRRINEGTTLTNSSVLQQDDAAEHIEAISRVDELEAMLSNNIPEFLLQESRSYIQGMNQKFAYDLFYGSQTTTPGTFDGINTRMNSTTTYKTVISAGGASALTSVYLVVWSPDSAYCFYPRGTKAGLQINDLGKGVVTETTSVSPVSTREYVAYRTQFTWDCGLTIKNWRQVARLANIATGSLTKNAASGTDIIQGMIQLINLVQNINAGRAVFYVNRTIKTYLDLQETYKSNGLLRLEEVEGKMGRVLTFRGIPVILNEQITNAETQIT